MRRGILEMLNLQSQRRARILAQILTERKNQTFSGLRITSP
jgi:hypothetical protein